MSRNLYFQVNGAVYDSWTQIAFGPRKDPRERWGVLGMATFRVKNVRYTESLQASNVHVNFPKMRIYT